MEVRYREMPYSIHGGGISAYAFNVTVSGHSEVGPVSFGALRSFGDHWMLGGVTIYYKAEGICK